MSQVHGVPGRRSRTVAVGLALCMMALAVVGFASSASADFTTAKCAGPNILGRGASFARDAHSVFNFNFKHNYCVGTPGQDTIDVAYDAAGSGAGRLSMKVRNDTPRFGQSDEPPTTTEIEQMDKGTGTEAPSTDTNVNDNGKIHIIPAAVGAVAPLVNFPDGCNPELLADQFRTISAAEIISTPAKKALLRVRFPKTLFEEVWAGVRNAKWSEAFPELAGNAACEVPIIRVVRFDESGTTFAFKNYLNTLKGDRGWLTTYAFGGNLTKEWPNAEYGTGGQCGATAAPGKQADTVDHLTSGCSNGNGTLTATLIATDGSVGYSDVSTARNASPSLAIDTTKVAAPTTPYWTQVQNGSNVFTEPTADPNGYQSTGTKGANCNGVVFSNVPADTLDGDWSKTSGVNAPGTLYGICTLTYGLVFDDNAAVWGNTPGEEAKARSVKDYWESVVSDAAQGQLFSKDYAPLPAPILALSRAGVAAIGWDKAHSGKKEEEVKKPEEKDKGSSNNTTPPSNEFSFRKSTKKGTGKLSVKLPGAGTLDVLATARVNGKKVTVAHVVVNATAAGTFDVNIKPKGAAKKALKEKGKLTVSLKLTFTPSGTGGTAKTSTSSLTLKAPAKK